MFKQRLFTALILVPAVLLGIYFSNATVILSISLMLMFGCAVEGMRLIPLKGLQSQALYFISLALLVFCSLWFTRLYYFLGCAGWTMVTLLLITHPRLEKMLQYRAVVALLLGLFLPLFVTSLYLIVQLNNGKSLLLYLLFLVWAADIGAYIAGKRWGKHRLIPAVSPGKTWEGLAGGFIASQVVALISCYFFSPSNFLFWLLAALMVFIVALVGDLFISLLKRRVKIKDTGSLLPGHGGLLDRLDSLIATAPIFYLLLIGGCWLPG